MYTDSQNFAIVQTELDDVFYQTFNEFTAFPGQATVDTSEVFKTISVTNAAYIEEVFSGVGLFSPTNELQPVATANPSVANKYTVYPVTYTNGITLSKQWFDDNMHGVWAKTVQDFARKARVTMDTVGFGVFRGAFTTTLTADGTALINSAHPLISGGTESNLVTGALSTTTLNDAIVKLGQMKDQSGIILGNQAKFLLVPPALFNLAMRITDSALYQGTGNNDINTYRSAFGIRVYTSPYLGASAGGSDTAWFLMSDNHSITRYKRQGIATSLRNWTESNNLSYYYQANFRETYAAIDYNGIVGSTGL